MLSERLKKCGADPTIGLGVIGGDVLVGFTGVYLSETFKVLETVDEIKRKASKIGNVKDHKVERTLLRPFP